MNSSVVKTLKTNNYVTIRYLQYIETFIHTLQVDVYMDRSSCDKLINLCSI